MKKVGPVFSQTWDTGLGVRLALTCSPELSDGLVRRLVLPNWRLCRNSELTPRIDLQILAAEPGAYSLRLDGEWKRPWLLAHQVPGEAVQLVGLQLAQRTPSFTFVHAGSLAWKGRLLVLPGFSQSGKSTLVEQLVRLGFAYYSDEYAVVDSNGLVHAYPRDLHRRESATSADAYLTAARLGWCTERPPLPVSTVLLLRYEPGSCYRGRRLSRGNGVLRLLEHTVSARTQPQRDLANLTRALRDSQILESRRGEARETAEKILGLLQNRRTTSRCRECRRA